MVFKSVLHLQRLVGSYQKRAQPWVAACRCCSATNRAVLWAQWLCSEQHCCPADTTLEKPYYSPMLLKETVPVD